MKLPARSISSIFATSVLFILNESYIYYIIVLLLLVQFINIYEILNTGYIKLCYNLFLQLWHQEYQQITRHFQISILYLNRVVFV